jgi:hypothetical protein
MRGEPPVPLPGAEITGVECDAELLADQMPEPRRGPQLSLEAVVAGQQTTMFEFLGRASSEP